MIPRTLALLLFALAWSTSALAQVTLSPPSVACVDTIADLRAMRTPPPSSTKGVQVLGPIDHGFCQSIYFEGPEGLNLEISTGSAIDERA